MPTLKFKMKISVEARVITQFFANCSCGHVNAAGQTKLLVQIGMDKGQVLQLNRVTSSLEKEVISNSCAKDAMSCGRVFLRGLAGVLYARVTTLACAPQHPGWPIYIQTHMHALAHALAHTHALLAHVVALNKLTAVIIQICGYHY